MFRKPLIIFVPLFSFTYLVAQDSSSKTPSSVEPNKVSPAFLQLPYSNQMADKSAFNYYSTSAGFGSLHAKGFANSFSYGLAERFDSTENYSSVFNAPMGELFFNPMDVERIEINHTGQSGNFGNAASGSSEITPSNPFYAQKFSISQQSGFNASLGLYNQTAFRYAQAYGKKQIVAFHISGDYTQKREWQFDSDNDNRYAYGSARVNLSQLLRYKMYDPVSPTFTQHDKDDIIKVNSWVDFNPMASPGVDTVYIPGYAEAELTEKNFRNAKIRGGINLKLSRNVLLSTNYRFSIFNTIVQPYFRYQLKNFTVHQPVLELKGKDFFIRTYAILENSGNAYNLNRTGYHLVRRVDSAYISDYSWNYLRGYFSELDTLTSFCEDCVTQNDVVRARNTGDRYAAQTTYPQKGTAGFDTLFKSIISQTNPANGSGYKVWSKTFYAEGEYRFGFQKWLNLALGANYQLIALQNNEWKIGGKLFHDAKAHLQASKNFWKERIGIFASGQYNYNTDFGSRGDYLAGFTFTIKGQSLSVSSSSGYVFPTFAQRYMNLDDYYAIYRGDQFVRDKWYSYNSILNFEKIQGSIIDNYDTLFKVLKIIEVTPLRPQDIRRIELRLKNTIAKKIFITTNAYYNWVSNTQALAYVVSPTSDTILPGYVGNFQTQAGQQGIDALIRGSRYYTPFLTWTNLPVKTNSWGVFFDVSYSGWHGLTPYFNYHYFGHKKITVEDDAIVSFNDFNTPMHKLNAGIGAEDVWKGLGFNINFRWVSGYDWQTDFVRGAVPSYHTMDLMIQYRVPKIYSTITIGAINLYNNRHTEIPGSPRVGAWYYAGWRFDLDLSKRG